VRIVLSFGPGSGLSGSLVRDVRIAPMTAMQTLVPPALPGSRQRGAALLTAMLIVALVATLATSMLWQQWRAVQVEAAERARAQSAWILSGALDWARLILREDARNGGPDHLGEPWAVPLAEARLSTFLAADKANTEDAPDAFLSGSIIDAQARFNLNNVLLNGTNRIDKDQLAVLLRLCETVGVSADVASRIANGMSEAAPPAPPHAGASAPAAPLPRRRSAGPTRRSMPVDRGPARVVRRRSRSAPRAGART
jgi:general secretion pathway protein K